MILEDLIEDEEDLIEDEEESFKDDNDYIITSDTDSLFIWVKDLLLHRYPNIDIKDRALVSELILEIAAEIQEAANNNLDSLVVDLFNIKPQEPHYFQLKQEVIAERGYFSGKRRYAIYVINSEGTPKLKMVTMGLDLMKSNFPPMFKKFGEDILKNIMFGKDKNEIDNDILAFKKEVMSVDWKFLLKPTGLKKLEEYRQSKPGKNEIFSTFKTKCPQNTKSAIIYNDFLKHFGLTKTHADIRVGDKMFIAYLKNNPFKIKTIGYKGYNDPEEITDLISTYIDRELLFESIMKNKIEGLYKDIGWPPPIFNQRINKFFK